MPRGSAAARARFVLALAPALALACSDGAAGPGAPPAATCTPRDPDAPPSVPAASLRADVLPIFAASCSLNRYCHADPSTSQGGLYLGPNPSDPTYPPDDATIAAVRGALVGAPSVRAVSMPRVAPGAPGDSFLMHKIDGDQNCSDILCEDPLRGTTDTASCGDAMPPNGAQPLPPEQADRIRAWILGGALDD